MLDQARRLQEQLTGWRREFHQNPELGFQEVRTAARVAEELQVLGYRTISGVGRTGVVGERGQGQPIIAIRADMDALPIQEANPVPYASKMPGVMHACGHDAHIAIALGTASLLAHKDFPGTVRFLFQPAEEIGDEEGVSGAVRMIEDGAMEGVEAVIALHVDATTPAGDISIEEGGASAGVDTFYATIIGRGGHGAMPHFVVDPVYLCSHVLLALHGIVSRRIDPYDPAVVSIGSIHGGEVSNVIPDRVEITGTIRFLSDEVQRKIQAEVERALSVARTLGGDYQLRWEIGYPPCENHPEISDLIRRVGQDLLGPEHLAPRRRTMGAEDFGFISRRARGAMFWLGCAGEGEERRHHSPNFDIDESCLPIGVAILGETALRLLRRPPD